MKKSKTKIDFCTYLKPQYLLFCQDAITSTDTTVTTVRLIDDLIFLVFPAVLQRFCLVAEFRRNESVSIDKFLNAEIVYKIQLVNPAGERHDLKEFRPQALAKENPWTVNRLILNLSGQVILNTDGIYWIVVLGKTKGTEYTEVLKRDLPVKKPRGISGLYKMTFTTTKGKTGEGLGVISPNGLIQGGDNSFRYSGSYTVSAGVVKATVHISKQGVPAESIFGKLSEFDVDLSGKLAKDTITLTGHRTGHTTDKFSLILQRTNQLPTQQIAPPQKQKIPKN